MAFIKRTSFLPYNGLLIILFFTWNKQTPSPFHLPVILVTFVQIISYPVKRLHIGLFAAKP
jgi:hypothetical protein